MAKGVPTDPALKAEFLRTRKNHGKNVGMARRYRTV